MRPFYYASLIYQMIKNYKILRQTNMYKGSAYIFIQFNIWYYRIWMYIIITYITHFSNHGHIYIYFIR